jgi:queuine tRNA-ribosyltransferase
LTPRTCIESQLRLGADVVYCLDYCTHPSASRSEQERSVELTLQWAKECRATFDEAVDRSGEHRPLLFAVVQGGQFADLRAYCAQGLTAIGFDGYGFGGYPIVEGQLVDEVLALPELVTGAPLHGLGIGTPEHLVTAWRAGFDVFDCVLPTRNGRRGVLYASLPDGPIGPGRCSTIVRLADERWVRERGPIDQSCDCLACSRFSAGYLAHLFRIEDGLAATLGSIHNLRFYTRLLARLRSMDRQA